MVTYLAKNKPLLARAILPIYGLPNMGEVWYPKEIGQVPILQLHDR